MSQQIDIDKLMAKTWLIVTQLRHGQYAHESEPLYAYCCQQIDTVKNALTQAKLSPDDIEHIVYAQCALLDETAMAQRANDEEGSEAFYAWRTAPLQVRYFSSLDAGEALWNRVKSVLGQVDPADAVLTCFHRVLMLGFIPNEVTAEGRSTQRELLIEKLSSRISLPELSLPLVINHQQKSGMRLLRSFGFWTFLLIVCIGFITWGGQLWLNQLLSAV